MPSFPAELPRAAATHAWPVSVWLIRRGLKEGM